MSHPIPTREYGDNLLDVERSQDVDMEMMTEEQIATLLEAEPNIY